LYEAQLTCSAKANNSLLALWRTFGKLKAEAEDSEDFEVNDSSVVVVQNY